MDSFNKSYNISLQNFFKTSDEKREISDEEFVDFVCQMINANLTDLLSYTDNVKNLAKKIMNAS